MYGCACVRARVCVCVCVLVEGWQALKLHFWFSILPRADSGRFQSGENNTGAQRAGLGKVKDATLCLESHYTSSVVFTVGCVCVYVHTYWMEKFTPARVERLEIGSAII